MLYRLLKTGVRITAPLYFQHIELKDFTHMPSCGPVLLLPNHPSSFLDAVIFGAFTDRPIYFLARGDAFNNRFFARFLRAINMLPVYRLSEGKENLPKNTETFDTCAKLLRNDKVVLIFAEGISRLDHTLRDFKKGPARIARKAWLENSPANTLQIVPAALGYAHFNRAGNTVKVALSKSLCAADFNLKLGEAAFVKTFNDTLRKQIQSLIYVPPNRSTKKVPAQQWYFYPLNRLCHALPPRIIKDPLFHDSIRFGLFLFLWPVYTTLIIGSILSFLLTR